MGGGRKEGWGGGRTDGKGDETIHVIILVIVCIYIVKIDAALPSKSIETISLGCEKTQFFACGALRIKARSKGHQWYCY